MGVIARHLDIICMDLHSLDGYKVGNRPGMAVDMWPVYSNENPEGVWKILRMMTLVRPNYNPEYVCNEAVPYFLGALDHKITHDMNELLDGVDVKSIGDIREALFYSGKRVKPENVFFQTQCQYQHHKHYNLLTGMDHKDVTAGMVDQGSTVPVDSDLRFWFITPEAYNPAIFGDRSDESCDKAAEYYNGRGCVALFNDMVVPQVPVMRGNYDGSSI
ncbi:MAG: hypothetical protein MJZ25_03970 [Fibrobacter sp.]|nr:hypothetical protein [Fibrobacter sp.]